MATIPQESISGRAVFRELSGEEMLDVLAHDYEQLIINVLATGEFNRRVKDFFRKTGRFGLGACYPVVSIEGPVKIKVFASIESHRSNEKFPEPFSVDVNLQTDELRPDSEKVCEVTTQIQHTIGAAVENAVDKVRKEVGLDVMIPSRDNNGYVVNSTNESEKRSADYATRLEKRKDTLAKRAAEEQARIAGEEERERIAKEQEARTEGLTGGESSD